MADQNPQMDQAGMQQPNINVVEAPDMFNTYVNAISANITTNEVTLQLGVTKPGTGGNNSPVTVNIVGNLFLTHQTAASMVNLLQNALKSYEDRLRQSQQQQQNMQAQNIPNEGMAQ